MVNAITKENTSNDITDPVRHREVISGMIKRARGERNAKYRKDSRVLLQLC